jgi:uroporphyrinogen-III decarboxylase
MTHRERILAALRGQPVDRLPWVPRLDLWYKANRYRGTLPAQWAEASLMEIVHDLGVGCHAVIPDFLDVEEPDQVADRALGLDHVPNSPVRVRFRTARRLVRRDGDAIHVRYELPQGALTAKVLHTEDMRRSGVTMLHVAEPVVKSLADYELVGALFEDLEVEYHPARYEALRDEVGEAGVVVAWAGIAASPVHHLLKELVPYDQFYFDLHDHPEVVLRTARRMEGYFAQVLQACCRSGAELVMFGANYDLMVTPPPLFAEHLAPWLKRAADTLHAAGKLLVTHTDGENDRLTRFYVESGVDVADSVCPAPMTRLTLADYRSHFGTRPAIWGGLCSICVLPESMSEAQFEAHVAGALDSVGDGRGIVFSLADTTPPAASVERIRRIGETMAGFGPVR